jgi:hypothetical protein
LELPRPEASAAKFVKFSPIFIIFPRFLPISAHFQPLFLFSALKSSSFCHFGNISHILPLQSANFLTYNFSLPLFLFSPFSSLFRVFPHHFRNFDHFGAISGHFDIIFRQKPVICLPWASILPDFLPLQRSSL